MLFGCCNAVFSDDLPSANLDEKISQLCHEGHHTYCICESWSHLAENKSSLVVVTTNTNSVQYSFTIYSNHAQLNN